MTKVAASAPIYPSSETEFFVKVVPIRRSLEFDSEGAAIRLTLHRGGTDAHGVKVAGGAATDSR